MTSKIKNQIIGSFPLNDYIGQKRLFTKIISGGFTLIELLVVIAIIGLLASIVLIALNSARLKARDAKRIADLKEIQTALELYYNTNSGYPNTGGCDSTILTGCWYTFLPSTYIASMPKDPLNVSSTYGYYYWSKYKPSSACGYTYTGSTNNYMLLTRLENYKDSQNSCSGSIGVTGNSTLNYIVGN